jgi:hypothetical protein
MHRTPNLRIGSPGDAERRARAAAASIVSNKRLALAKAYQAGNDNGQRDERADLLRDAIGGNLSAQVRCRDLYGSGWRELTADLVHNPFAAEDSES